MEVLRFYRVLKLNDYGVLKVYYEMAGTTYVWAAPGRWPRGSVFSMFA